MPLPQSSELVVSTLGPCRVPSPLQEREHRFVDETSRVLVSGDVVTCNLFKRSYLPPLNLLALDHLSSLIPDADLRHCHLWGICQDKNVIRSVVLTLTHSYGVRRVWASAMAMPSGKSGYEPMLLTPDIVYHPSAGGTLLGSSRGPQDSAI